VTLVLVGHYQHIRIIDATNTVRQNHDAIVHLPPHKMQSIDIVFTGPFESYCAQEIKQWIQRDYGCFVTVYYIHDL
jgi:hypothetical protein